MNNITQRMKYKQSVIKYSEKYGVKKASIKFNEHRKTIYRWKERYDGTLESLADKSRKPHRHPNEHTEEEIKLIKDMKAKNKETGLVVLWVKLMRRGYTRRVESLYRVMKKIGKYEKTPSKKKYISKPYERMKYVGERVQVDIKYVPKECLTKEQKERGERYYQYTAIDEYSRYRHIWFSKEKSTYSSVEFIEKIEKAFPFKIECIQTDNGTEFTNRLTTYKEKKTIFEIVLENKGIRHKLIKPYTPRHNGKVERSHRKDQERFYYKRKFHSFEDLVNQGRRYLREYNNFPMKPLKWKSPRSVLIESLAA